MPASREQTGPLGVVYTPPALARAMVVGLLGPLVKGRTARELLELRVCDPAMGDGAFLVEVVQYLAEQVVAASEREGTNPLVAAKVGTSAKAETSAKATPADRPCTLQEAIRRISLLNIVGLDIDPASVEKTIERLEALGEWKLPPAGSVSLRHGDALSFDWLNSFPALDAVIANPPYIRQESLAGEAIHKRDLRRWRTYDGVADVYVYFIELAHGLLREGGRYAVLAPNKWMTAEYARPLRSFLAHQRSVDAIVDLSAMKVFDDADAFPCVLFGTLGGAPAREIKAVRATRTDSYDAVVGANAHVVVVERLGEPDDGCGLDDRGDGEAGATTTGATTAGATTTGATTAGATTTGATTTGATTTGATTTGATTTGATTTGATTTGAESTGAASYQLAAALRGGSGSTIVSVDRAQLDDGPWHIDSIEDAALLARMKRECRTLGDIIGTRWSRGVVTGCNDAFIIDERTRDALLAADPRATTTRARGDTQPGWAPEKASGGRIPVAVGALLPDIAPRDTVRDVPIQKVPQREPMSTAELIRPFVKGRNIRSYAIGHPPQWILLVDRGTPFDALPPAVRAHLERFRERLEPRPTSVDAKSWKGRKPGSYAWHELQDPVVPLAKSRAPRMLYQDIQTAPLCALDTDGETVPDTTVWILPSQDLVLLAILNSPVYRWIAQRRFPPALNGAVRPKLQYMQQLPIPTVTGALRDEITTCVEQRIRHIAEGESSVAIDRELEKLVGEAYRLSRNERERIMPTSLAPTAN